MQREHKNDSDEIISNGDQFDLLVDSYVNLWKDDSKPHSVKLQEARRIKEEFEDCYRGYDEHKIFRLVLEKYVKLLHETKTDSSHEVKTASTHETKTDSSYEMKTASNEETLLSDNRKDGEPSLLQSESEYESSHTSHTASKLGSPHAW